MIRNSKAQELAAATEAAMQGEERVILTHGIMAVPLAGKFVLPEGAVYGSGYVPGIPRLGVPALCESDASLGVAYALGLRRDAGATPLPSATAMASSWSPELVQRASAMIGSEARSKGFNVMLAGGINVMRDPRCGRTFEYFSEDPLLSAMLGGAAVRGIQSNHMISTLKHLALNSQETGRHFVDSCISDAAARESDLLAFEIAIEQGNPGAIMGAYNRVNGVQSCHSAYLMTDVLKRDWGFPGFVMSDWGSVHGMDAAAAGLDQQSGEQLDPQVYFAQELLEAASADPAMNARLSDMNRRILYAIYANGLDVHTDPAPDIDFAANAKIAQDVAAAGIVLLKNSKIKGGGNILPLSRGIPKIAVIGGMADTGVLSGGGSSQAYGPRGPAAFFAKGGEGPLAGFVGAGWHRSIPLLAIRALLSADTELRYRDGRYISEAVAAAEWADVVIMMGTQWTTEGFDVPDLSLPQGQDAMIASVCAANPNTIVVLQTGGPVLMPWLDDAAAVVEAWYPGIRGAEALADMLFGVTCPSGRLPISFPADVHQLPRPILDGADSVEPSFVGKGAPGQILKVDYDIEGSDVGYRWYARTGQMPLFAMGYGLSYTQFEQTLLGLSGNGTPGDPLALRVQVRNVGSRAGADLVQAYLVSRGGKICRRLLGFQRVDLAAGQNAEVSISVDPRLLADWAKDTEPKNTELGENWIIAAGDVEIGLGSDALTMLHTQAHSLGAARWGYNSEG
jgi:beta-glucosidase